MRRTARVEVADPRRHGSYLRLSWHAEQRLIVVSQWRDGICVATTPIGLAQGTELIAFLVGALHEAAMSASPKEAPTPLTVLADMQELWRRWTSPRLASLLSFATRRAARRPEPETTGRPDVRKDRKAAG